MMLFSEKLKELRVAAGLSQEKLAMQLGTTVKTIQRYEGGCQPNIYAIENLAKFFNVSADYLIGSIGYKEQMAERRQKLLGMVGYNKLYSTFVKCLNEYEIMKDAEYYWIEYKDGYIGGQTQWEGWADDECKLEIRRLRPVIPDKAIESCTQMIGKPMVINSQTDAEAFLVYGGQAIVRADICEKYLPEFMKDFIS